MPVTVFCDHCGRVCGAGSEGGYGSIYDADRRYDLCHPDSEDRPDCYHLVTVYREKIGSRRD